MPGVIAGGVKKALAGSLGHFLITWVLNNGSYICGAPVAPYQSHHSRANTASICQNKTQKKGVFLQDKQIFCLAQRGKENAGARYAATESAWSLLAK